MSTSEDRDLGMDRPIARRDFLQGVALTVAGSAGLPARTSASPESQAAAVPSPDAYPPARTGLRGNHASAIQHFPDLVRGAHATTALPDVDTGEEYDLVIVGAGISGLAAAHFMRRTLGTTQKILLLDNHDDVGGHAKRNEFFHDGRMYVSFGGTMGIATPFPYSYAAKRLVEELGIEVERNTEFLVRELGEKYNLTRGFFFDKEHFREDRLVTGYGRLAWPEFFAKAPVGDEARKDLVRLYDKNPDYMAGLTPSQKAAALAKMSYKDFLLKHAKVAPDVIPYFMALGGRNNKRADTMPALEAAVKDGYPGFDGMNLEPEALPFKEASYTFHFPDGNASVARLLVKRLVPDAIPGKQGPETIVQAALDYTKLDRAGAPVRIRLASTVVRAMHEGDPASAEWVRVGYLREGKLRTVRARNCILACYNALVPALVPELPAVQKEALGYGVKVPMLYTSVFVRRWTAFQKLGISGVTAPGMYHTNTSLDAGTTIGGYKGYGTPEEPIIVHLVRNPNKPGLPRRDQHRAGQQELLSMTFEQFELEIRRQFARMLGSGGFDPASDILGITVNRWPYGYSYTYDTLGDPDMPPEQRPHVVGRRRFGRIAIANSDAGAAAFTNQAIDEAHRAVQELFVLNGLT